MIFDWNGTLIEDVPACVSALNAMLRRRELPTINARTYREKFDFPVISFYRQIGFDFDSEEWDLAAREFHSLYRRAVIHCRLRVRAREILSKLRACCAGVSLLSASETSFLESELSRSGLRDLFVHVRGISNIYADSKLDAAKTLVKDIGIPPSRLLMVGDTTHDAYVAMAVGCPCVLVAGGHQATRRLLRLGCSLVRSLDGFWSFIRRDNTLEYRARELLRQ